MSTLRILRPGYQTWNNDFIQWIDQYGENNSFSDAPILNTDSFEGTLYLASMVGGYYHLFGNLKNIVEIDTSQLTGYLQEEICDLSSIFPVNTLSTINFSCAVRDGGEGTSTYGARIATIQFATTASKLYVSNEITIPINQEWSIEVYLYPSGTVSAYLLSSDVNKRLRIIKNKQLRRQGE